jgi:3-methyladenine DNA glycosylase AlkC
MSDAPLLKDFVDRESVAVVASAVAAAAPEVSAAAIVTEVFDGAWEGRALKERIRHIAVTVRNHLPDDYEAALAIMRQAAAGVDGGWISLWAFNDFVEQYGVDCPDISLPALEQFTKLASAEFAVRPFIKRYPARMAAQMLAWAGHEDPRVRRLASEGFRPRLPWGMGIPELKKDPGPVIPILEKLWDDPSEDVRRSVANNLNDISKDHPQLAVDLLARWGDDSAEFRALAKHALRTLLKRGDNEAMRLMGFSTEPEVIAAGPTVEPAVVAIGDRAYLDFTVESTADSLQMLMVDYAVTFQNASGTGSRKVFKGKVAELGPGEALRLRRKLSLQPMSTRQIFPGPHEVEILVNGAVLGTARFDVTE